MTDDNTSALGVVTDAGTRKVTVFSSLFPQLRSQVRIIVAEKQPKRLASYAQAWQATQTLITKVVNVLQDDDVVIAAQGLAVSGDQRKAITNSIMSAWDKSASAAVAGDINNVDNEIDSLRSRLDEFDTAISKAGEAPVKADQ